MNKRRMILLILIISIVTQSGLLTLVEAAKKGEPAKKNDTNIAVVDKLLARLQAKDAVGFIALLPPRFTKRSKPNTDEASELLLQAAIAYRRDSLWQNETAINREIILALIVRGAGCEKADKNGKKTIEYLSEQKVSGDELFAPAIEQILQCEQRSCRDMRLDVAKAFLDAVIAKEANNAFAMLGAKGKKEFGFEEIVRGFRRMLPENLKGTAQCLAVIKLQNMDYAVCYVKSGTYPGIYDAPVQVGEEAGQLKAFTMN